MASGTDPDTGETIYTEETYTVAVPVDQEIAFNNLDAAGYPITEDLVVNAQAVYDRSPMERQMAGTGEIQYGSSRSRSWILRISLPDTKNAEDLVVYAHSVPGSLAGDMSGAISADLDGVLLEPKIRQHLDGVEVMRSVICSKWLGDGCRNCGLTGDTGWLTRPMSIRYAPPDADIGADAMYRNAAVKGPSVLDPRDLLTGRLVACYIGVSIGSGEVIGG